MAASARSTKGRTMLSIDSKAGLKRAVVVFKILAALALLTFLMSACGEDSTSAPAFTQDGGKPTQGGETLGTVIPSAGTPTAPAGNAVPTAAAAGETIAFIADRDGTYSLFVMDVDSLGADSADDRRLGVSW